MRKLITTFLAIAATSCIAFGVTACDEDGKVDAAFKTGVDTEVYVGDEVDLEDYIVRVKDAQTEISVAYKEETLTGEEDVEEIFKGFNTVFYPKEAGEHTITYKVSKGKSSDEESMTLTVKDKAPEIVLKDSVAQVQLTKKEPEKNVNFLRILQGDLTMSLRNTLQDIPDFVSLSRADYNVNLEPEAHEFNDPMQLVPAEWMYAINKAGLYRGEISVSSQGGETKAYFYVLVTKGEVTRVYKSKLNPETGAVSIQAGRYGRDAGAWTTDYGYYGLGLYEMGDTLTFEFKGQNIPNVAIFTDVPSGQPISETGKGMYIQTSTNGSIWSSRLSIASPNRLETGNKEDYDLNGDGVTTDAEYDKYDLGKKQDNVYQDIDKEEIIGQDAKGNDILGSKFGYLQLDETAEYRYTIQTEDAGVGSVKLFLTLEKKNGEGVYEKVKEINVTREHKLPATTSTYAIAYSAGTYVNKQVEFTYSIDSNGKRSAGVDRDADSMEYKLPAATNEGVAFYGAKMLTKQIFETTFVGNNMPDVALLADSICAPEEGKGIYLSVDEAGTSVYVNKKTGTPAWQSATLKTGDFQDGTQYSVRITHAKKGTQTELCLTLGVWNESKEAYDVVKTLEIGLVDFDLSTIASKHAILYGKATPLSCSMQLTTPVIEGATVLTVGTDDYHVANAYTNWSYVATETMELDEKLVVRFMGQNIPNLLLLADSDGGQAYNSNGATGKGYLFVAAQTNRNSDAVNYRKRFVASGPNRAALDASGMFGRNDNSGENIISSAGGEGEAAAWDNLNPDTDYVLSAWVTDTANGVMLHYLLKTEEGVEVFKKEVEVTDEYAKSLFATGKEGYHAILYGNAIADVTFTYEVCDLYDWVEVTQDNIKSVLMTATSGFYRLAEDIDMAQIADWAPGNTTFSGVLDGNGHVITNMSTGGLFGIFAGTLQNVSFTQGNYPAAQKGIVADRMDGNATLKNVVIKTTAGTNSSLGGVLCRYLHTNLTMENVVIVTSTIRSDNTYGFICGFADTGKTVTMNNCYFLVDNGTTASGVRTGAYYNALWDAANTAGSLKTSATDTQYSNFLKGDYTIYANANVADSVSAFASNDFSSLSAELQALYNASYVAPQA